MHVIWIKFAYNILNLLKIMFSHSIITWKLHWQKPANEKLKSEHPYVSLQNCTCMSKPQRKRLAIHTHKWDCRRIPAHKVFFKIISKHLTKRSCKFSVFVVTWAAGVKWKKNVKIVKSNFRRLGKKIFSRFGPLSFLDLVEEGAV